MSYFIIIRTFSITTNNHSFETAWHNILSHHSWMIEDPRIDSDKIKVVIGCNSITLLYLIIMIIMYIFYFLKSIIFSFLIY